MDQSCKWFKYLKEKTKQNQDLLSVLFFTYFKCTEDPPSNATKKGSMNPEKLDFSLLQKSNVLHCKGLKIGAAKHFHNVSVPAYTNAITIA